MENSQNPRKIYYQPLEIGGTIGGTKLLAEENSKKGDNRKKWTKVNKNRRK